MPIEFRYDRERGILFTTARGLISLEDVRQHLAAEASNGYAEYKELFDATAASTNMTPADVRFLAAEIRIQLDRGDFGPTAIVAQNDVVFGMARMLEILSDLQGDPVIGVFRDKEEAINWLRRTPGANRSRQARAG